MRTRWRACAVAALFCATVARATPVPATELDAARFAATSAALAGLLDRHAVLHVGEFHRDRALHGFLRRLLRSPEFSCRIDDVVVESGNARLQPLADAYAGGAALTEPQLQSLWRETLVPLAWNSPVYRELFEAVRQRNASGVCPRPLRLVLGDVPVDWSTIHDAADLEPFADRGAHMAGVVEREVLAKGRRALLLTGAAHALARPPPGVDDGEATTAMRLDRRHPGAVFTLATVANEIAAERLRLGPPPALRLASARGLRKATLAMTYPKWTPQAPPSPNDGLRLRDAFDGVLFVGAYDPHYPPPAIYLEPDYQRELRRRAAILREFSGQDFAAVIDDLVRQAREGGSGVQNNIP